MLGQGGGEVILLSLIYFIIVLSILVLIHEFGHFITAKKIGVRVEKFSIGFGPKIFSVRRGDTEYLVSSIPLGGYVKLAGDEPGEALKNQKWEFFSRCPFDRFKIIVAGPIFNYILAFLIFSFIFMLGSPTLTTEVGGFLSGYPAETSGLRVGDKVIAVDGKAVKYWEDMTEIIHRHDEGPVRLSLKRDNAGLEMEITPIVRQTKDIFGKPARLSLIGISPSQKIESIRHGFFQSFVMGYNKVVSLTVMTCKALYAVITGRLSVKESMTGPIGIFVITGQAAKLGLIYILNLMGILSTSLAIFNLLPFPVLDGGHILFLGLEKLMGRPLSNRVQEYIMNFGIAFLILLTVLIFYNDIVKFGIANKVMGIFKR